MLTSWLTRHWAEILCKNKNREMKSAEAIHITYQQLHYHNIPCDTQVVFNAPIASISAH